jgi:hypothetical protein
MNGSNEIFTTGDDYGAIESVEKKWIAIFFCPMFKRLARIANQSQGGPPRPTWTSRQSTFRLFQG